MGYINHEYILVTHYDVKKLKEVREELACIWRKHFEGWPTTISEVLESPVNGYGTIIVAPDGSKESWDESESGDNCRDEMHRYLVSQQIKHLYLAHDEYDMVTFKIVKPEEE